MRLSSVWRSLSDGVKQMDEIASQISSVGITDRSLVWNTDLIESLELENLMSQALVTIGQRNSAKNHAAPMRMKISQSVMMKIG